MEMTVCDQVQPARDVTAAFTVSSDSLSLQHNPLPLVRIRLKRLLCPFKIKKHMCASGQAAHMFLTNMPDGLFPGRDQKYRNFEASPFTQLSLVCKHWQMYASPHRKSWLLPFVSFDLLAPHFTSKGRTPTVAMETALDYHKRRPLRSDQDQQTEIVQN